MKKLLALVLTVVVALTVASAASAHPSKQVRRLRHQLHNMALARNSLRTQLATSQTQVESLQSQLAQSTADVSSALATVTSLRARIAAIPTPLSLAFEQVQREVAWATGSSSLPHGELVAMSALDYAYSHVSVGAYGYLEAAGSAYWQGIQDPNFILSQQAGVCGQTMSVFAAIVEHFGYPVRSVQFVYTDRDGTPNAQHIAGEVYYDGAWHFFDPTFATFWKDSTGNVLSITDARNGGGTQGKDSLTFTNLIEDPLFGGDDSWFETDPTTAVGIGQVTLYS